MSLYWNESVLVRFTGHLLPLTCTAADTKLLAAETGRYSRTIATVHHSHVGLVPVRIRSKRRSVLSFERHHSAMIRTVSEQIKRNLTIRLARYNNREDAFHDRYCMRDETWPKGAAGDKKQKSRKVIIDGFDIFSPSKVTIFKGKIILGRVRENQTAFDTFLHSNLQPKSPF